MARWQDLHHSPPRVPWPWHCFSCAAVTSVPHPRHFRMSLEGTDPSPLTEGRGHTGLGPPRQPVLHGTALLCRHRNHLQLVAGLRVFVCRSKHLGLGHASGRDCYGWFYSDHSSYFKEQCSFCILQPVACSAAWLGQRLGVCVTLCTAVPRCPACSRFLLPSGSC